MTEFRPIEESEAASFLEILCQVFELTYERVQGVFYSEPFFDLNRKWAAFEAGRMVSVLTTVPLTFGWGKAIGVAGVATVPEARGQGIASRLLGKVLEFSRRNGEGGALLFARDSRLYEACGLERLDDVVQGALEFQPLEPSHVLLSNAEVETIYNEWADKDPNRLRRDEQRWKYWRWHLRLCHLVGSGYVCHEGATVREVVDVRPGTPIRSSEPTRWSGLKGVAEQLELPLYEAKTSMFLMGVGFETSPQMFLTDQF